MLEKEKRKPTRISRISPLSDTIKYEPRWHLSPQKEPKHMKFYFVCFFIFMLQLITPDISHKAQWEEIILEWDDSQRRPRIFFQETFEDFLQNTERLSQWDDIERQISKSSIFFLIDFENNRILGFFWLRHNLKFRDDIQYGWHIGYWIRSTDRRKGYAKEWLRLTLLEAKKISIDKIFVSCDDENIPSAKVIEANEWVLESNSFAPDGTKRRRYWIDLK